jgi:hypothetical protein
MKNVLHPDRLNEKAGVLGDVTVLLLRGAVEEARALARREYAFRPVPSWKVPQVAASIGPPQVDRLDALDVEDDGLVLVTDAVFLLDFLFRRGLRPPEPFVLCGPDITADGLDCLASPGDC